MDPRYPNDPTPYDNSGPEDEAPEREEDTNDQYGQFDYEEDYQ